MKISSEFCKYIINSYAKEPHWQQLMEMIKQNKMLNTNITTLLYTQIQELLYYKNIEKRYHLCIFSYLYGEVFALVHDSMEHPEYAQTHKRLTDNLYLPDLFKHLHKYIHHCFQCQLMQMSQHCLYELLQPILTSS